MPTLTPEAQFEDVKKEVLKAVQEVLTINSGKSQLKVHQVWVQDNKDPNDLREQQEAIKKGRTWRVPVKADIELVREGKTVDRRKVTVMHLPKTTHRFSYILNGNEYQPMTQFRQKSGVYHRRADDGTYIADFNLANRDQFIRGKAFKVVLDPEKALFEIKTGNSKIPAYWLLRGAGVKDADLRKAWGDDIWEANKKAATAKTAYSRFFRAVNGKKPTNPMHHSDLFLEELKKTELREDVTKATLGKAYTTAAPESLVRASENLLNMSRGKREADDRASLEFQTVHSAGDLLAGQIRARAWKIQNKLRRGLHRRKTVRRVLPASALDSPVNEFFRSSIVSQPEQTNPLAMLSGQLRTTIMGDEGGYKSAFAIFEDSKLINPSHLGFLDPIHTPEGERTGVNLSLPLGVEKDGENLVATYKDAKTGLDVKLRPGQALRKTVAFSDQYEFGKGKPRPRSARIKATREGEMVEVSPKEVDVVLPSPRRMFGIASNLIPFLQNNQGNRAMTAARQQEQAVPLVHREAPLVQVQTDGSSTFEQILGRSYAAFKAPAAGEVVSVGKDYIKVKDKRGKVHEVQLYKDFALQGHTLYDSEVVVKRGQKVKKGQILADSTFTKKGTLALGTNLRTAYIPFLGYNFEDGIVISDKASTKLTSQHIYKKDAVDDTETVVDRKKYLAAYPYEFKKDALAAVGEDGVVRVGQTVKEGDPLVLMLRKPDPTATQRRLKVFRHGQKTKMRNRAVVWDKKYPGIVTDVVRRGKYVHVYVKTKEPAQVGDKLVGRHGNKGVITRIVPETQMPYSEGKDGEKKHIQIAMNPLGVPSRINLGQVLETAAGKVAEKTGRTYRVRNFEPGKDYLESVKQDLADVGLEDKEVLIDPRTGKPFEQKVLTGNQYILKLRHQVSKKMSTRSGGPGMPYDINHVPAGGSPHGGQSMGELGLYAMLAHGARENVYEMFGYKTGRNDEAWRALRKGQALPPPKTPFVYEKFLGYLNGLRLNVKKEGNHLQLLPFTEKQVRTLAPETLSDPGLALLGKNLEPEKGGIFDKDKTGGPGGSKWSRFELAEAMPNPMFEGAILKLLDITGKDFRSYVEGSKEYKGKKGGAAIEQMLKEVDLDSLEKNVTRKLTRAKGDSRATHHDRLRIIKALKESGNDPTVYMMTSVPVLPPSFRPFTVKDDGSLNVDDVNYLYRDVAMVNHSINAGKKAGVPTRFMTTQRAGLYDGLKALSGLGGSLTREYKGLIERIKGDSPKDGFFHKKMLKRRQDFSARSTITPEPNMGLDEVGVPEKMAWTLYKPLVERELVKRGYPAIKAVEEVKKKSPAAKKALTAAMADRPVMLKRDPALHRYNVMAFKPRLTPGEAVEIHPLVTSGFNADFDGDTMSVYLPIGPRAVRESAKLFPSNNLFSATTGAVMYTPGHESLLGLYLLSKDGKKTGKKYKSSKEALSDFRKDRIKDTDIIEVAGKKTTIGKMRIRASLPPELRGGEVKEMTKGEAKRLLTTVAKKHPGHFATTADRLKNLGNDYSYRLGFSIGLDDFATINKKERDRIYNDAERKAGALRKNTRLKKEIRYRRIVKTFEDARDEVEELNKKTWKNKKTNILQMVESSARGSEAQLGQIVSSPALVMDAKSRVVPHLIRRSYAEGMDMASYWTTMHGARKGTIQKVQGVQKPGEISKMVVNSTMDQLITEDDCGTREGVLMSTSDLDINDRYLAKGQNFKGRRVRRGDVVTPNVLGDAARAKQSKLLVRSPLRCEAKHGICKKCMGLTSGSKHYDIGDNVGVTAAQSIGEPSVQLSLNVFHTGGLAKGRGAKSTETFARLRQLLEMPRRLPRAATLAGKSGTISKVEKAPQGGDFVWIGEDRHWVSGENERQVKRGDRVEQGQKLSTGPIDPRGLLELKGITEVQDHLADEIHGVLGTAAPVKRRNVEVVVKSLTNLAEIEDPGGHPSWIRGDLRPVSEIQAFNKRKWGKRRDVKYKAVLKGVDMLPLEMSEDWIARMNYRRLKTTLTEAAREGWRSNIHGFHPVPGLIFTKEFGRKDKTTGEPWRGQY